VKKVLAIILAAAALLVCFSSCAKKDQTEAGQWELLSEAYRYTFPLVLMDLTMKAATNTKTADLAGHAPVNQLIHSQNLANADTRMVCEKAFGLDGMWLGYSLCEGLTLCVWALTARRIGHGDLLLLREDSGGFLAEESTPEALRQRLADSPLTPAERDRVGAVLDESAAVLAKNKTTQLFARREGTQTVAYLSGDAAAPQASALPDTAAQPCDLLGIHRTVLRITMREEA